MSRDPAAESFRTRLMEPKDWSDVARLIYLSLNVWTERNRGFKPVQDDWQTMLVFPRVYESLDPNCCVLVEEIESGRIAGSCFFHPRPTHVALGILNTHPDFFGRGVASRLLKYVVDFTEKEGKPLRLVSGATNLDSFSLYSRAGFVPTCFFQDLTFKVPEEGVAVQTQPGCTLRDMTEDDVPAVVALEKELVGIDRERDYRFFLKNEGGIWHAGVLVGPSGTVDGFMISVKDPGSNMLGPGLARTEEQGIALVRHELNFHRGRSPIWLVPARARTLLRAMYDLGARNCDLHVSQLLDKTKTVEGLGFEAPAGIVFPTFLPETG